MLVLDYRSLLSLEMTLLFLYALLGPSNPFSLRDAARENELLKNTVAQLHEENLLMKQAIDDWNTYPFFKEQFIREQLQMAKKNETLYYK